MIRRGFLFALFFLAGDCLAHAVYAGPLRRLFGRRRRRRYGTYSSRSTTVSSTVALPDGESNSEPQWELWRAINLARTERGLHQLEYDETLAKQAQSWAMFMSRGNRYHSRMDYAWENIAWGQGNPTEAVRWWLGSPPHRRHLLSSSITRVGPGAYATNWVMQSK